MKQDNIDQRSETYGTRAALGTPDHFYWHAEGLEYVVDGNPNDLKV